MLVESARDQARPPPSFEELPDETLFNIFRFLPSTTRASMALVSRRFRHVAQDPTLLDRLPSSERGKLLLRAVERGNPVAFGRLLSNGAPLPAKNYDAAALSAARNGKDNELFTLARAKIEGTANRCSSISSKTTENQLIEWMAEAAKQRRSSILSKLASLLLLNGFYLHADGRSFRPVIRALLSINVSATKESLAEILHWRDQGFVANREMMICFALENRVDFARLFLESESRPNRDDLSTLVHYIPGIEFAELLDSEWFELRHICDANAFTNDIRFIKTLDERRRISTAHFLQAVLKALDTQNEALLKALLDCKSVALDWYTRFICLERLREHPALYRMALFQGPPVAATLLERARDPRISPSEALHYLRAIEPGERDYHEALFLIGICYDRIDCQLLAQRTWEMIPKESPFYQKACFRMGCNLFVKKGALRQFSSTAEAVISYLTEVSEGSEQFERAQRLIADLKNRKEDALPYSLPYAERGQTFLFSKGRGRSDILSRLHSQGGPIPADVYDHACRLAAREGKDDDLLALAKAKIEGTAPRCPSISFKPIRKQLIEWMAEAAKHRQSTTLSKLAVVLTQYNLFAEIREANEFEPVIRALIQASASATEESLNEILRWSHLGFATGYEIMVCFALENRVDFARLFMSSGFRLNQYDLYTFVRYIPGIEFAELLDSQWFEMPDICKAAAFTKDVLFIQALDVHEKISTGEFSQAVVKALDTQNEDLLRALLDCKSVALDSNTRFICLERLREHPALYRRALIEGRPENATLLESAKDELYHTGAVFALHYLRAIEPGDSDYDEARYLIGICYDRMHCLLLALRTWEIIPKESPFYPNARFKIGVSLSEGKGIHRPLTSINEVAIAYLSEVPESSSDFEKAQYKIGLLR